MTREPRTVQGPRVVEWPRAGSGFWFVVRDAYADLPGFVYPLYRGEGPTSAERQADAERWLTKHPRG